MNPYGFIGIFKAHSGKRDALVNILLQAASSMSEVKGCRQYLVCKDAKEENTIVVTEIWDTQADHDNALKMEGSAELIAKAMPLLDGRPEGRTLEIAGGKGIVSNV